MLPRHYTRPALAVLTAGLIVMAITLCGQGPPGVAPPDGDDRGGAIPGGAGDVRPGQSSAAIAAAITLLEDSPLSNAGRTRSRGPEPAPGGPER